jgi:hypothetical protein
METITRRNLCDFHRRCLTITQQAKKQLRASTESLPHVVGIYSEDSSLRLYHRSTCTGAKSGNHGAVRQNLKVAESELGRARELWCVHYPRVF